MTEEELLKGITSSLEKLKIPYALTGALAVSFYGYPRATHDFDIIVQIQPHKGVVSKLADEFREDFYLSEEAITDAVIHNTMFNMIHHGSSHKVDLWILKDDAYSRESFKRRKSVKIAGKKMYILSPEDIILSKLIWYKESENDKHVRDVNGIMELQKGRIDNKYLKKWAPRLSVLKLLHKID